MINYDFLLDNYKYWKYCFRMNWFNKDRGFQKEDDFIHKERRKYD